MKTIWFVGITLAILSRTVIAETIICSYPPYASIDDSKPKKPVILDIKVQGDRAFINSKVPPNDFRVLENTKFGLILAHTFATREQPDQTVSLGAFVLLIDRTNATITRGNVIAGESVGTNKEGTCIFH